MSRFHQTALRKLPSGQAIGQALAFHQQGHLAEAERLYQGVLKSERNQFDALHLLGMLRYQQGRYSDAQPLIAAALRSNAASVVALSNYGLVLNKLGRGEEAIAAYDKALALAPDDVNALYNRGIVLHALGRYEEALQSYDRALAIRPDDVDALGDRGNALRALGHHEAALASYDQALRLMHGHVISLYNRATLLQERGRFADALKSCNILLVLQPHHIEALNVRGASFFALNQFDEALADFDRALAINPQHVDVLTNRGRTLLALDCAHEALETCDRALAIAPDQADVLHIRGDALQTLDRYDEALATYDRAIAVDPGRVETLNDRGHMLTEMRRYDEALTSFDRALSINPEHVEALNNCGVVLQRLGRPDEALAHFERVVLLAPRHTDTRTKALTNRGTAFADLGQYQDALSSYQEALAGEPDDADAHFHEAKARLCLGDFREGWKKYEWRWGTRELAPHQRDFTQVQWLGEDSLEGRTILLHAEDGFGDAIQFARYAPLVAQQGATVVLEVQPSLTRLMADIQGVSQVVARGQALPSFDLHCPLLSLPLAFKTELDTIPSGNYLRAPHDRAPKWERRLGEVERPRVGLVWSGGPAHLNDRNRSIALGRLSALLSRLDVGLVSLQQEVRNEDAAVLAGNGHIVHLAEEFGDFADTAAAIAQLDLVISVDTSVAHLAGALGKPVWILLPFASDFRWMRDRQDTPWYPAARLFRQPKPGDWESVIARVCAELDGIGH